MEYANTLNIIAKQPHVPLPSYTLRALMKDIKCDNILLHSPPGSGRVYVKISDFGLAKKEDFSNEQTYLAGTIPYWAPELFHKKINSTQKVDIYASGIIFFRLLSRRYPVDGKNKVEQCKMLANLQNIERPQEIKDDILWDLLSRLLEFDPDKRITVSEALQHPYFTSPEAIADVSKEQQELAQIAKQTQLKEGNFSFTKFDKDPTFIVAESVIKQFILEDIRLQKLKEQQFDQQKGLSQQEVELKEEFQTVFSLKELEEKVNLNEQQQIDEQVYQIDEDHYTESQNQKSTHSNESELSNSQKILSQKQSSSSSFHSKQTIYSIPSRSISKTHSNQVSLSYIATEQQLQVEQDLIELNMTLEEIKEKLLIFELLTIQYLEIISINFYKRIEESNEYNNNIGKAISLGIIDDLIILLNTLSIEQIYLALCDPIVILLRKCDKEQKQLIIQKGGLRWTLRMLLSENEDVINGALYNTHKIISAYLLNEEEGKPNILREELEQDGTLKRIIQVFSNDNYKHHRIKSNSSFALAGIFKATQLPSEFGPQIINNLKSHIKKKITHLLHQSLTALSFLAECRQNHDLILSEQYLVNINILFNQKWAEEFYPFIFIFLSKLFKFGDDQTKEKIKSQIDQNKVEELLKHPNPQIVKDAFEYLKFINPQSYQENNNDNMNEKENQKDNKNIENKIIGELANELTNKSNSNQKQTIKQQQQDEYDDEGNQNIQQSNDNLNQQDQQVNKIQEKDNEQEKKNDQDQEQTNEMQHIGEQRIKELNRIDEYLEGKQEQKQKSNSQEIEDSNYVQKENQDQKDKSNDQDKTSDKKEEKK